MCINCVYSYKYCFNKTPMVTMDKVSASQPRDRGFETHTGHDNDSSYDTGTSWFQEADSRVINLSCDFFS